MEYDNYYIVVTFFVVLLCLLWLYGVKNYNYWKDHNIYSIKPFLPYLGNIKLSYLSKSNLELINCLYKSLSGKPYGGIYLFTKPVLLLRDPDLIKKILVTDFNHFVSRGFHTNDDEDPLSKNLIHVNGKNWKYIRPKFQAAFGLNKLKSMVNEMDDLAKEMVEQIENGNVKSKPEEDRHTFEAINLSERYMIDVVCSSVFGVKSDAINLDLRSAFYDIGRQIFDGYHFLMHVSVGFLFPYLHSTINMSIARKKVTNFFTTITADAISLRNKPNETTNNEKKNLLDALITMKREQPLEEVKQDFVCDEDFVTANLFMFFAAGFDSSAKICTFALYELAANLDIQETARKEAISILKAYDDVITLEAIQKMTYLEQIVAETNRKYPILSVIFRRCDKSYVMPDGGIIEPGVPVIVPSSAIHFDPEYYAKPEIFNPDRFHPDNKSKIHPATHLPFGMGPRICVAWQFAIFEIKIILARILSQYKISLHRMNNEYPLKLKPKAFLLTPQSEIYIDFLKLTH